ncbi:MAG: AzlD domain-containing protein [Anaerolineaceae bacterium]|nr:MAG: AzlD domain-containing protein [Anaerolineaceae bacterium]
MSIISIWGIIIGGMVVTYAIRLSFIALVPQDRMPDLFRRSLRYVPPAVLAALITPELFRPAGPFDISLGNHRLIAGVVAAIIAWRSRNTWITIATGMIMLWLLSGI